MTEKNLSVSHKPLENGTVSKLFRNRGRPVEMLMWYINTLKIMSSSLYLITAKSCAHKHVFLRAPPHTSGGKVFASADGASGESLVRFA